MAGWLAEVRRHQRSGIALVDRANPWGARHSASIVNTMRRRSNAVELEFPQSENGSRVPKSRQRVVPRGR
jgi:hypothetical protein